jgi:peptide/nickel transport system substrate-binding protein
MATTRRDILKTTGAITAAMTMGAIMGGRAYAQGTDTLRIGFGARGLRTIDPLKSIQGVDAWAIIAIYDKLVDLPRWRFPANQDELVPRLATAWSSSEDAKTWTVELRQGVKFHKDYGDFTSEDVKFTFERAIDPVRAGGVRSKFLNIEGVDTDGPHKAVFRLKAPDPLFMLGVLTDYDAGIMSKKAVAEIGEEEIATNPIGTGVYALEAVHSDPSQGVTLTANTEYWDTPAVTPKIQCLYIADTTARTLALLGGTVHLIEGVRSPGWADSMKQRDSSLIFDVVSPGSFFTIHFNLTKEPFDNAKVRQALFHAIDRDEIATAIAPVSNRTYGLNPPSFPGAFTAETIPAEVAYPYDQERAKALLAEAGFADGLSFRVDTSQREDYSAVMLMIQDQLRRINVNIDLNIKDHTAFHADQRTGSNTLTQQSAAFPPVPTQVIVNYLQKTSEVKPDGKGGENYSHYGVTIPGIDDLLQQALDEANFDKRVALTQQIETQVLRDAVLLPVCTNGFMIVRSAKVDLGFQVESGYVNWPLSQARIS